MAGTATYIYCLVESARKPAAAKAPRGLPKASAPELLAMGRKLWAVAAEVPLAEYGTGPLEARLADINWVADIAIAHEAVVERFAAAKGAAVVPMKLFTMFSSQARAQSDLGLRRREIDAVLKRTRGCREWGVRVMREAVLPARPAVDDHASGTAFLTAKKRVRDEAQARVRRSAAAAEAAYAALAKLARDSHRHDPPANATTPPLVDAAFLVADSRQTQFKAAAKRAAKTCRAEGASLILTGPWPAYNFVTAAAERA
jgi:hypothetical protein